ncbi:MAG: hypothetical protein RLZZ455_81 [Candidatus Parcubacteria bacterium]
MHSGQARRYELNRGMRSVDTYIESLVHNLPHDQADHTREVAESFFYTDGDPFLPFVVSDIFTSFPSTHALFEKLCSSLFRTDKMPAQSVKEATSNDAVMHMLTVMFDRYTQNPHEQSNYAFVLGTMLAEFPIDVMSDDLRGRVSELPVASYETRLFQWVQEEGSCILAEDRFVQAIQAGSTSYDGVGLLSKTVGVNSSYSVNAFRTKNGVVVPGNYYLAYESVKFWNPQPQNQQERVVIPQGQKLALLRSHNTFGSRVATRKEIFDQEMRSSVLSIISQAT